MKIKQIKSQNRRDFIAIYICEHCDYEEEGTGYDDTFFHESVIPKMKCKKCGETSGQDYKPRATKYPDSAVV